ncbi:MAG: hypothetical protein K5640_00640 [Treponema sp.]|nr:hypothetical protein [Treponema sp.]
MKIRNENIVSNLAALLLLIFAFTVVYFLFQFSMCFPSASAIPRLSRYPVVRVCIYGSSTENGNSTVSARIALLDSDNTEFAVIERSWNGYTLSMEFLCTSFSGKTVCFPFRIYGTDSALSDYASMKRGTKLYPYYMEDGSCLLFGTSNSPKIRKSFYRLARYAFITRFQGVSDFSRKQNLNFSDLRTGETYTIYTGFDGSLFIAHD